MDANDRATARTAVANAPCVLFAYHAMGYAGFSTLLEMGAPIAALFTHRDDPDEEIWWESCLELARSRDIPVDAPETIDHALIERVAGLRPALIYSFNYRYLLPDELLKLARCGAFNLHGALLPRYRGRAPVNWVLINGERETGVTLHHMVRRADAGDIVGQRAVAIGDEDTALSLFHKLVPLAVELIREFHPLIVAGRAPRHPQDLSKGCYVGRRRPRDGRIDWRWPARRIFNMVRAVTHPYPGAFCFANGRKLLIWCARITQERGWRGAPGEILGYGDGAGDEVEIAAGEGCLRMERVQFEDCVEGAAADVLSGWQAGARLE
ncbi:MAG: formyltransferase [Candidatus Binataceae bacterium]